MFNKQFIDAVEHVKDVGTCNYKFRCAVCVDGHIRHTMAYYTISIPRPFDNVCQWYGASLKEVYKSAIMNLDVNCEKETVGYLPGVKRMYSEHVFLLHINGFKLPYEDRGVKHLYKHHHNCSSRRVTVLNFVMKP